MNYKEKYHTAIENIKKIKNANKNNKELVDFIEYKYPELIESKDERIRRALIRDIGIAMPVEAAQKYIAWLEKQGGQNPADKVEPKFKVGDWIVIDNPCKIISIDNYGNYLVRYWDFDTTDKLHTLSKEFCETYFHLWTIQDAKDGDVLTTKNFIFIFSDIDDDNCVRCYCHYEISNHEEDDLFEVAFPLCWMGRVGNGLSYYSPATKEQRDLLFTKMKEAGYEWDDENGGLKEVEQKSAWSEEDERIRYAIFDTLDRIDEHIMEYNNQLTHQQVKDWLKSIKERLKGE